MIKKILQRILYLRHLFLSRIALHYQIIEKDREIDKLKTQVLSPRFIIEQLFSKGIEWYDWNDMPLEERKVAYQDAQRFVTSPIIQNIKNMVIAKGAQAAMMEESPNTQKVRDFQMSINGIELLFEELERIHNPLDDLKKGVSK